MNWVQSNRMTSMWYLLPESHQHVVEEELADLAAAVLEPPVELPQV